MAASFAPDRPRAPGDDDDPCAEVAAALESTGAGRRMWRWHWGLVGPGAIGLVALTILHGTEILPRAVTGKPPGWLNSAFGGFGLVLIAWTLGFPFVRNALTAADPGTPAARLVLVERVRTLRLVGVCGLALAGQGVLLAHGLSGVGLRQAPWLFVSVIPGMLLVSLGIRQRPTVAAVCRHHAQLLRQWSLPAG